MKKLLKMVVVAFLGILPTVGSEEISQFLNKEDAIYSLRTVYEVEGENNKVELQSIVDRTTQDTKAVSKEDVPTKFTPKSWENNDIALYAKRKGTAFIFGNGKKVEKEYTKEQEHPYKLIENSTVNLVGEKVLKDIELSLNEEFTQANQTLYTRPDSTEFVKREMLTGNFIAMAMYKGEAVEDIGQKLETLPLTERIGVYKIAMDEIENFLKLTEVSEKYPHIYDLIVKEERTPKGMWYQTVRQGEEKQKRGLNWSTTTRYWYKHFNQTQVDRKVFKIANEIEIPVPSLGKSVIELLLTKTEDGRENHPTISEHGWILPLNSKII